MTREQNLVENNNRCIKFQERLNELIHLAEVACLRDIPLTGLSELRSWILLHWTDWGKKNLKAQI